MASEVHCIYCFETLTARLEKRAPLSFSETKSLWTEYGRDDSTEAVPTSTEQASATEDDNEEEREAPRHNLRPRQISRLQSASPASSSNASTPSNASSSDVSKTSSKTSLSSFAAVTKEEAEEEYPLFVTWNTVSSRGHKNLRGCIGTFEAQPLSRGLKEYAAISAFNDHRFSPISVSELEHLSCEVTLLQNFTPCSNALDWELGTHGIRISFSQHNRRYSSTYLPQVAPEQGWSKEETIVSLMRKAGWNGRSAEWRKVGDLKMVRYEGKKTSIGWEEYSAWRRWVDEKGGI